MVQYFVMNTKTHKTHSLQEFQTIIDDWFTELSPNENEASVVALSGNLGVGKTTLVQRLAKLLGNTAPVTSPTFTIAQFYREITHPAWQQLVHIDAYRLNSYEELEKIQFETYKKDKTNLICIEWPELVGLKDFDYKISIEHGDTDKDRIITFWSQ